MSKDAFSKRGPSKRQNGFDMLRLQEQLEPESELLTVVVDVSPVVVVVKMVSSGFPVLTPGIGVVVYGSMVVEFKLSSLPDIAVGIETTSSLSPETVIFSLCSGRACGRQCEQQKNPSLPFKHCPSSSVDNWPEIFCGGCGCIGMLLSAS